MIHAGVHRKLSFYRQLWIWLYGRCIKIALLGSLQYFFFILRHISRILWGKRVWKHRAELIYSRKEVTFCQGNQINVYMATEWNSPFSYTFLVPHKRDRLLRETPRIGRVWPHQNRWHLSPRQNSVARAELPSSVPIWGTYQKVAVVKRGGRERFGE
jgi:hypothetical protein